MTLTQPMRKILVAAAMLLVSLPNLAFADTDFVPIFRMTSSQTERLLTTSCQERTNVSKDGNWFNEGVLGFAPSTPQPDTVKLYRFASRSGSQHFYTVNRNEGLSAHLKEERFDAYLYSIFQPGLLPVHRLAKSWEHFYTSNSAEAESSTHSGYKDEGIIGYVIDMQLDLCPLPRIVARPGFGGFDWSKAATDVANSFRKNTGPAWEHIKTDTGPAINQGWLHFIKEVNAGFNLECADTNPNCSIHSQSGQERPADYNYDPQSLVTGIAPCKGPGSQIYPAGTITYFYNSNGDELVCSGHDNGRDPGYAYWTPTGRHRLGP